MWYVSKDRDHTQLTFQGNFLLHKNFRCKSLMEASIYLVGQETRKENWQNFLQQKMREFLDSTKWLFRMSLRETRIYVRKHKKMGQVNNFFFLKTKQNSKKWFFFVFVVPCSPSELCLWYVRVCLLFLSSEHLHFFSFS